MCGVFGHTGLAGVARERSRRALDRLSHRGPDQWSEWSDGVTYIGHRRLSIIDLSERGRQPMVSADGSVVIAVNGEVYNYRSIRRELEETHAFTSESDSEVVLHGYRAWGMPGLLRRMEGMYAGCVLDRSTQQLFLFRDRVGIKPLYYGRVANGIVWSSELGAIEALAEPFGLRPDATAYYDFCTYLYVPAPKTIYADIRKLEPAHFAAVDLSTLDIATTRYWQLETTPRRVSENDAVAELRDRIGRAVEAQLMSDVPIGCFLSGGLDSSSVVSEAVARHAAIRTCSIGFDVARHTETEHAARVAAHFGTTHRSETLTVDSAAELIGRMRGWFGEPFADTSALPTYLVSAVARRDVTVVLSGDGGDEVFGGYGWYRNFRQVSGRAAWAGRLRDLLGSAPRIAIVRRAFRRAQRALAGDDLVLYTLLLGGMVRSEKKKLRRLWGIPDDYDDYWHFRRFWRSDLPLLTRLQYVDFHTYLPDDILTKVDRTSMAVALEVRVPLLATDVVEFSFALPEPVRFAGGVSKGLLKQAYRDRLPPGIADRPKKGFSAPVHVWGPVFGPGSRSLQENILRRQFADQLMLLGARDGAARRPAVAALG